MKLLAAASVAVLGLAGLTGAAGASSITYVQTSDHCTATGTAACGIDTNNKVVISETGTAGQVLVTETLDTGWLFISTGAGKGNAIGFALPNSTGYTF